MPARPFALMPWNDSRGGQKSTCSLFFPGSGFLGPDLERPKSYQSFCNGKQETRFLAKNRRLHTSKFSFIISFLSSSPIAQSVERRTVNPQVAGSSPARGAKILGPLTQVSGPLLSGTSFLVPVFDARFSCPGLPAAVASVVLCASGPCIHDASGAGAPAVARRCAFQRLFLACDASRVCRIMVAGRPGLACFPSGGGRRLPVIESGCESGGCRGWNRGSWTKKNASA